MSLEKRRLSASTRILVVLLFCTCAAWAYHAVDDYRLRESLYESAQDEIAHYRQPYKGKPDTATVAVVTTAREYVFFGTAFGKVDLFVKNARSSGDPTYAGVEMGFELNGEGWTMTDSGGCSDASCVIRAKKAFGDT
ncbi:MAG: hypothetical protein AMXMBFR82_24130 [Candidatus Hydrogenedentota bacterium]